MASFLCELWLALALGIAHVLSEHFERDLTLLLLLVVLHVQPNDMTCDGFVDAVLSDVPDNKD
tara:strand:- start:223 stop:411 length:189 start_codon:yes stop_codon:yes gene_type:complete